MNPIRDFIVNRKISTTITLAFVIASVLPLTILVTSYFITSKEVVDKYTVDHLENISEWQKVIIKQWMTDHFQPLKAIASSNRLNLDNPAEIKKLLAEYENGYREYDSFGFVDEQGNVKINTSGNYGFNVKDREYFQEAIKGYDHVSEVLVTRTNGKASLVFAVPVRDHMKIRGVLVGRVPISHIQEVLGTKLHGSGEGYVLDKFGNLISAPNNVFPSSFEHQLVSAPAVMKQFVGKNAAGVTRFSDQGKNYLGVHSAIPEFNVYSFTKQDIAQAYAEIGATSIKKNIIMGYSIILLLLPLVFLIARMIAKPVLEVAEAVQEISVGNMNFRLRPFTANKEIAHLGERINDMAENLEKSNRIIRKQIDKLEQQKNEIQDKNEELMAMNQEMTAMNEELSAQNEEIMSQNEDLITAYDQLTIANQNLELMATTDQLTGAYNRRYFMDRLKKEITLSKRTKRPLSILLMDLDYFKSINDTFGHAVGDAVLKTLTRIVTDAIRITDVLARFGGEEFIILAPDTDQLGAAKLAEKIRSVVESSSFRSHDKDLNITLSIGVCELTDFTGEPEKLEDLLIMNADKSLYHAKNTGRNRIGWEA